jgi:hypothetical protein
MKAAAFLLAAGTLLAQQPAQAPQQPAADDQTRIQVDVTRVNILFTVSDKKGRFVTDLARDDFEIVENKRSQKIMEFTAEFRFIQVAAVEFVNSVMRP